MFLHHELPRDKSPREIASRLLLEVKGGIGRNIMATAVVRELKKKYPEKMISVIAGASEVFYKNPHIYRVHNFSRSPYLFDDYFRDTNTLLLNQEPYQGFDYVYRRKHFTEVWCDLLGIPCGSIEPELFYNLNEKTMAQDYISKFDRRMVLFQHQGGKVPEKPTAKDKVIAKSGMYRRNLPERTAQEVTDGLIKMGYMVGSVGHPNQFLPKGAEQIKFPIRAIIALVPLVEAVISIDSFLIHASACYKGKTPTLALWGGTDHRVLGYPWHTNISRDICPTPRCHRPNSYLWDMEESGYLWDCPHNDICMNYRGQEILEHFETMMKEGGNGKLKGKPKPRAKARAKATKAENHPCREAGVPCPSQGIPRKEVSAGSRSD